MNTIIQQPTLCLIQTASDWANATQSNAETWSYDSIDLTVECREQQIHLKLTSPFIPIKQVRLRWELSWNEPVNILNDHWERGYGDLRWQRIIPEMRLPWYTIIQTSDLYYGYGVMTNPSAICHWEVDQNGITLALDVRCGTQGVELKDRQLLLATVLSSHYSTSITSHEAVHQFCKSLCPNPILPTEPVYGGNNWYYAYGKSSHDEILEDSKRIATWSKGISVKPFMVIDDGWQMGHQVCSGGPWLSDPSTFPDMQRLAHQMKDIGVRPGIWYRPLLTLQKHPESQVLSPYRFECSFEGNILDPSHPDVLEQIKQESKKFVEWGYELIKYDFSTFDIFGKWGFDMKDDITKGHWHFFDINKTTAEIITQLYKTIYDGATGAYLIGCNTIGHLGTGYIHIQRTGDDTSGQEWERTRKMGVNTLAYRMPQHNAFYFVDADCVGITPDVSWEMNQQWLDVLAKSQTPLFISASPKALNDDIEAAIVKAFHIATQGMRTSIPLDWMNTSCPSQWDSAFGIDIYDWFNPLQKATSRVHATI